MKIVVRNAPTSFGKVGYMIASSVDIGFVEAVVRPPTRTTPKRIAVRLRQPHAKPVTAATANGMQHQNFDPKEECVVIGQVSGEPTVRVQY